MSQKTKFEIITEKHPDTEDIEEDIEEDVEEEFEIEEEDDRETSSQDDEETVPQDNEEDSNIIIDNEEVEELDDLYHSYKHLIGQVVKFNKEIHTMMTILRYQYDYYSWWNITVNIMLITMSSIITFLESLRANVTFNESITLIFNITTITFGFLIALSLAIFKFLKVQDNMESVRSGILTLEMPYQESCKIYLCICNKIFGQMYSITRQKRDGQIEPPNDSDDKQMKENIQKLKVEEKEKAKEGYEKFLEEWKQTRTKSIFPELQVQQLLTQMQLYDYWKKYLLQDLKNIKMVNRRNFDIKLYESSQNKMTSLKMEMMTRMNELVEERRIKNLNVEEIENIWKGDMILLDRLQENYDKIMDQTKGDKVRFCPRECFCHRTMNSCCTSLRNMFRKCGCCCCKKDEMDPEDIEMILKARYDEYGKLIVNYKENKDYDEEQPRMKI